MTNKTEDKFYFGNIGTKAESELTVRITKMLGEVERAVLSRNQEKAKSIASKVREMIRKSANTSTAKMQMDELNSIMLGVSFSREGKSERFGMAEQVMRDGSVHLDFSAARDYLAKQSDEGLRYIIKDAKSARDAMGTAGRKFHYYTDLVLEAQKELKKRGFSRPGQPERFAIRLSDLNYAKSQIRSATPERLREIEQELLPLANGGHKEALALLAYLKSEWNERYRGTHSRSGSPERFMRDIPVKSWKKGAEDYEAGITEDSGQFQPYVNMPKSGTLVTRNAPTFKSEAGARKWLSEYLTKHDFSRPGQPERFGLEDACWEGYEPVGTKQQDGRTVPNCVPKDENAGPEEFAASDVASAINRFIADIPKGATRDALQRSLLDYADNTAAERRMKQQGNKTDALRFNHEVGRANEVAVSSWLRLGRDMKDLRGMLQQLDRASFSRPGQPDKFDASSLNRGDFAEASTSPMLGKLLAAKVMPEGGWRAVQVGSDTLVISFEDADLASDFGRRVATKGYNATSPVQAIGRYWNVEVKNG